MKEKMIFQLPAVAAGLLANLSVAQACSVCITGTNDPTAAAFNASVLFLMFTPYLVVGSIAGALFFVYRRAAAKGEPVKPAESIAVLDLNQEASAR